MFTAPKMPPLPKVLESHKQVVKPVESKCPPCQQQQQSAPDYYRRSSRSHRKRGAGSTVTFFLTLFSATCLFLGIALALRLSNYAPGGLNADSQKFAIVQVASPCLIGIGVLLLVLAWFL